MYLYPSAIFTAIKPLAVVHLSTVRIARVTIVTSGSTCLYGPMCSAFVDSFTYSMCCRLPFSC